MNDGRVLIKLYDSPVLWSCERLVGLVFSSIIVVTESAHQLYRVKHFRKKKKRIFFLQRLFQQ
ncbi:hypothetical protein DERP_005607, partial [Dermatophagoides pteronyssinus]